MGHQLNDRIAIVTGAGRGLGRAHALALAARGAKVIAWARAFLNDSAPIDGVWEDVTGLSIDNGELVNPVSFTGSQSLGGAQFGASIAMRGNLLVVGAPGEVNGRGATYLFLISGPVDERTRIEGSGTSSGDGFGSSVSYDGANLIVGAPGFTGFAKGSRALKGRLSRARSLTG